MKTFIETKLNQYLIWRERLSVQLSELEACFSRAGIDSDYIKNRISNSLDHLLNEQLCIAIVGEFSRGKTELVNALFFSEYGRLLPSRPGRTTLCPVEIYSGPNETTASLSLLPIATRESGLTLDEYKKLPDEWLHIDLDASQPDQIKLQLACLEQTVEVSVSEAHRLGFVEQSDQHGPVEIPKWRHSLFRFPHPLLKKGLKIIDTPGLNALGHEPDLTLKLLPSAHMILFVLSVDTGVSQSDMRMWESCMQGSAPDDLSRMVVLNRIDHLWDNITPDDEIARQIEDQCQSVAQTLNVDRGIVFPASANRGLAAKYKKNEVLYKRSGIEELELYLSENVVNSRETILINDLRATIGTNVDLLQGLIKGRRKKLKEQLQELKSVKMLSDSAVNNLLRCTHQERNHYEKSVEVYTAHSRKLNQFRDTMHETMDLVEFQHLCESSRQKMQSNWTTPGLRKSMLKLFESLNDQLSRMTNQTEEARRLVRKIYRRFKEEHGFSVTQPAMFSTLKYRMELDNLANELEVFRKSPKSVVMEKNFLIRHFFNTMVEQAGEIFQSVNVQSDLWLLYALEPLRLRIHDHKEYLDKRIDDLQQVSDSRDAVYERIDLLNEQLSEVEIELTNIKAVSRNMGL